MEIYSEFRIENQSKTPSICEICQTVDRIFGICGKRKLQFIRDNQDNKDEFSCISYSQLSHINKA